MPIDRLRAIENAAFGAGVRRVEVETLTGNASDGDYVSVRVERVESGALARLDGWLATVDACDLHVAENTSYRRVARLEAMLVRSGSQRVTLELPQPALR